MDLKIIKPHQCSLERFHAALIERKDCAHYICASLFFKSIKICPNQHADLHRIFFIEGFLKIKKGLELVSRPHFWKNFFIKKIIL